MAIIDVIKIPGNWIGLKRGQHIGMRYAKPREHFLCKRRSLFISKGWFGKAWAISFQKAGSVK